MHDGMEPEVKKYLLKILYSLCYGLLWLTLNVLGGIYWGYGIIRQQLTIYNILFYVWFLGSLGLLLYYYYRTWKKTF